MYQKSVPTKEKGQGMEHKAKAGKTVVAVLLAKKYISCMMKQY